MGITADVRQELKCALTRLWRARGFSAAAVLTLAVGIGLSSAMLSVIDALLLRPPAHIVRPDEVVRLLFIADESAVAQENGAAAALTDYPTFVSVKESKAFAGVAAYSPINVSVGTGVDAIEATGMLSSTEYARVLGTRTVIGTWPVGQRLDSDEGGQVVLSYGFWQRQYGRDSSIVGRQIVVNGRQYEVAGVAPDGFNAAQALPIDLWLPMSHLSLVTTMSDPWRDRGSLWLHVIGRLRDGTSASASEQRASITLRQQAEAARYDDAATALVAAPLLEGRGGGRSREAKVSLWIGGLAVLVLLIACANVSNLILARNFARRGEYAVRLAIGASSQRLLGQVLADVAAIVAVGLCGGVVVSLVARAVLAAFVPSATPVSPSLLDVRAAALVLADSLFAFAVVGALSVADLRMRTLVRRPMLLATAAGVRNVNRARHVLIAIQAALCLALTFFAVLFSMSLRRVRALDLGVDLDRTLEVRINLTGHASSTNELRTLYGEAAERLRAVPGIQRVALAEAMPYMAGRAVGPWTADRSFEDLWSTGEVPFITAVGSSFFSAVGASSLRGRDFTDRDRAGSELVAIVNEPLARRLFPVRDALGQCIWYDGSSTCARIVGVLGGVWKFSVIDREKMVLYVPLAQVPTIPPGELLVRTREAPGSLIGRVRSSVQSIRPDLPAVSISLPRDLAERDYRPWRVGAIVFAVFGMVAMTIAAFGLYSVVAFATECRLREIGVRMALGARWPQILRVVAGQAIVAVLVGLAFGDAIGIVASHWMSGILFQTSPRDSFALTLTAVSLLAVAALAVVLPVLRAIRLNPAVVLRSE